MADEIELKFIDINKEEMIKKLESIGAVKEYEEDLESRHFDSKEHNFSGSDSNKHMLRVRKQANDVFITYKSPNQSSESHFREEVEIKTDNFDDAVKLFSKLGLKPAPLFKKKRTHFVKGDMHFEIDELGIVPPYLEIEVDTEGKLKEACKLLGLDPKDGHAKTIVEIYPDKFLKYE